MRGLFRRHAGASRRDVWEAFARERGAEFRPQRRGRSDQIAMPHDVWHLVLGVQTESNGTTSTTYTRLRARFLSLDGLTFKVSRRTLFSPLAHLLGRSEVRTGSSVFDRHFVVWGKNPGAIRSILAGTEVGQHLLAHPSLRLAISRPGRRERRQWGDRVRRLSLWRSGTVRDPDVLEAMFRVGGEILDQLARIGSASREPLPGTPDPELRWRAR